MKGDKVTVHISNEVGPTQVFDVVADKSGRTIDIEEPGKNERMLKVTIKGRTGKAAETHMFAWDRVVAVIDGRKETEET